MHAHAVSITSNTLKPGSTTKFTRTARTVRKPTQHGISYAKNAISAGYRFTSGGTATTGIMTMAGTKTHGTMITTILTGQAVKGVDLSCSVCSFLSPARGKNLGAELRAGGAQALSAEKSSLPFLLESCAVYPGAFALLACSVSACCGGTTTL